MPVINIYISDKVFMELAKEKSVGKAARKILEAHFQKEADKHG